MSQVDVEKFGAKGDGVTDDTTAIQYALNKSVEVGFELFFRPATYLCGFIIVPSGACVRGMGRRSIIKLKPGSNSNLWAAFGASDIDISRLKFVNDKASNTVGSALIFTQGCTGVSVDRCDFTESHGGLIFEGAGGMFLFVTNNIFRNNEAAISVSQAAFCHITDNCLVGNGGGSGNAYQINMSSCSHSTVTANTIYGLGGPSGDAGVRVSNGSSYITVTANTAANCSRGLMVVNSEAGSPVDICFNGNIVRDSQYEGCLISHNAASSITRIGITGNHISGAGLAGAGYDLVRVDGPASQVTIAGTIGAGSTGWGVRSTANGFGVPDHMSVVNNLCGSGNALGDYSITATTKVVSNNL